MTVLLLKRYVENVLVVQNGISLLKGRVPFRHPENFVGEELWTLLDINRAQEKTTFALNWSAQISSSRKTEMYWLGSRTRKFGLTEIELYLGWIATILWATPWRQMKWGLYRKETRSEKTIFYDNLEKFNNLLCQENVCLSMISTIKAKMTTQGSQISCVWGGTRRWYTTRCNKLGVASRASSTELHRFVCAMHYMQADWRIRKGVIKLFFCKTLMDSHSKSSRELFQVAELWYLTAHAVFPGAVHSDYSLSWQM